MTETGIDIQLLLLLTSGGLFSGILAGFLGIGGGTVLVPLLVALDYKAASAVATSSLAILVTATSASLQNWLMGFLSLERVVYLGLPALVTAQLGAYLANQVEDRILLVAFGFLLLLNIFLVEVRKRIVANEESSRNQASSLVAARFFTGGAAGLLAGLFGVGGGVIMVPLQIVLLGQTIKVAIQTSLGVIVITAISACIGHAVQDNFWLANSSVFEQKIVLGGIIMGMGGLVGAQLSTRLLPKLPDEVIAVAFRTLLAILALYIFWQAWSLSELSS